jgi:hypothetical protein
MSASSTGSGTASLGSANSAGRQFAVLRPLLLPMLSEVEAVLFGRRPSAGDRKSSTWQSLSAQVLFGPRPSGARSTGQAEEVELGCR